MDCRQKKSGVSIRFLEHTADIGIEVEAPDLKQLLEAAVCALLNIVADLSDVEPREKFVFELGPFTDEEDMLFELLNEVIYIIDAKGMVFSEANIELSPDLDTLRCELAGEKIDLGRHSIKEQVKAATYHQMCVEKREESYFCRVIFDV